MQFSNLELFLLAVSVFSALVCGVCLSLAREYLEDAKDMHINCDKLLREVGEALKTSMAHHEIMTKQRKEISEEMDRYQKSFNEQLTSQLTAFNENNQEFGKDMNSKSAQVKEWVKGAMEYVDGYEIKSTEALNNLDARLKKLETNPPQLIVMETKDKTPKKPTKKVARKSAKKATNKPAKKVREEKA